MSRCRFGIHFGRHPSYSVAGVRSVTPCVVSRCSTLFQTAAGRRAAILSRGPQLRSRPGAPPSRLGGVRPIATTLVRGDLRPIDARCGSAILGTSSEKTENMSDKMFLSVEARYPATALVASTRTVGLAGRRVVEPGAESPRVVVLQARPVRGAGRDRTAPPMPDRWALLSTNPRRTLPSHVAEAYRPSVSKKQGTQIDVYV